MIDELASIIGVESEYGEGDARFDIFNAGQYTNFAFAPGDCLFSPTGRYVDEVYGISVVTFNFIAAVGNGISLYEAGLKFIPLVSLNGYLFT